MAEIFGYTPEEMTAAMPAEAIIVPEDRPMVIEQIRRRIDKETPSAHYSFRGRRKDGAEIQVEVLGSAAEFDGHTAVLGMALDITEQKKLESQFLRAQRLDSIGVLAGGIAHDLNNALAPILMSAQLLEMDPDAPERKHLLDSILTSAQRSADLVKQILTFASGTNGRRLPVQPHHLLEELQKILRQTLPKSIRLQIHADPEVRAISADATQLQQVLMNLCINARDAMPQGGELSVSATNAGVDESFAAVSPDAKPGTYVVITVTDNGTGMPPEISERIFDPFFTTKDVGKGTGLGLSTSLGIIRSHGGFINVYSHPNHGSCFKIYLPAVTAGSTSAETQDALPAIIRGQNELILVVDDEPAILNLARRTLEMFGYRIVTAANGEEAVACYQQQRNEIALVMVDMMMPVLDGAGTILALAQINPDIKIIAASGLTSEGAIARRTSPAVRDFLPKPYTASRMLKAIHEVLHQ
jgi:PAS domain S-box-containing protein